MTEPSHGDAQALWQSQPDGDLVLSLDEIRWRARRLERIIVFRNAREYVAAAVVVPAFAVMMWVERSALVRISAGLVIAATVFVVYHLHRHGTTTRLPVDLGTKSAIEFHRAQLERQRDLLRSVWFWYVLPFIPGLVGIQIGLALSRPAPTSRLVIQLAVIVVASAAVHLLNRWGARRLQGRIDQLKARA